MCRDDPNNSTVEISLNTEKSPGDLRRLAVTESRKKRPSGDTDVKKSPGII